MNDWALYTTLRDLLYLIFSYKRVFVLSLLAVMIPTVLVTCGMTPVYEAKAKILVETEYQSTSAFGGEVPIERPRFTGNEMQIITSGPVLRRVIEESGLNLLDADNGFWAVNRRHRTTLGQLFRMGRSVITKPIGWLRVLMPGGGGQITPEQQHELDVQGMIGALQSRIEVIPIEESQTFELYLKTNDPELSYRLCNAIADAYVQERIELTREGFLAAQQSIRLQIETVEEQIDTLNEQLLHELALAPPVDPSDLIREVRSEISEIQARLVTNQTTVEEVRDRLQSAEIPEFVRLRIETEANPVVSALYEQRATVSAQLLEARANYPEDSRQVQDMIEQLASIQRDINNAPPGLEGLETQERNPIYVDLLAQAQNLRVELIADASRLANRQEEEQSLINQRLQWEESQTRIGFLRARLANLQRESQQLESRAIAAGLGQLAGSNRATTTVSVIERPFVPRDPAKPQVMVYLVLGVVLGVMLGTALVSVYAFFDHTIKSPEQAEHIFNLPVLATLPDFEDLPQGVPSGPVNGDVIHQMGIADAHSSVAMRLLALREGEKPIVALVTSATGREGTSTFLAHLSTEIAQEQRQRVVLIDANHRIPPNHGPHLSSLFGDAPQGGLLDSDVESLDLETLVRRTSVPRLGYVALGTPEEETTSAELAKRVKTLVDRLSPRTDVILIDSPPAVPYADYLALTPVCTTCVLVVEFGKTKREVVARALSGLRGVCQPMGLVLNRRRRVIPEWLYRYL